jgi:hypothetical protein
MLRLIHAVDVEIPCLNTSDESLPVICALERELHEPATRGNRRRLEQLLHAEFWEIGRSGTIYLRAQALEALLNEERAAPIRSQEFRGQVLADGVVLLTYKSAEVGPDGAVGRYALRSSVWRLEGSGWRILFHQGTATGAFGLLED